MDLSMHLALSNRVLRALRTLMNRTLHIRVQPCIPLCTGFPYPYAHGYAYPYVYGFECL